MKINICYIYENEMWGENRHRTCGTGRLPGQRMAIENSVRNKSQTYSSTSSDIHQYDVKQGCRPHFIGKVFHIARREDINPFYTIQEKIYPKSNNMIYITFYYHL